MNSSQATNEANMVGSSSQATNEANIMGSSTNASPSLSGGDLLSSSKSESTSTDADSCKKDPSCADNSVPLGLGLGGLDRKVCYLYVVEMMLLHDMTSLILSVDSLS